MTITPAVLVSPKFAEPTQYTQYAASGKKAMVDKFTATNVSSADVDLSVHIVSSGDAASTDNMVLKARRIGAGETYTCPEVAGHVLGIDYSISTLASSANSLVIMASGREIT